MATCKAIIAETMHLGLEIDQFADEKERKKQARAIWLENAEACRLQGAIETAKAILANAIALDSSKKRLWNAAQELEAEHGTTESLSKLLEAGSYCVDCYVSKKNPASILSIAEVVQAMKFQKHGGRSPLQI